MSRAAVDIGTNTCRLLIVDDDGGEAVRELRITRLGETVDGGGSLADDAVSRTLDALASFREIWNDHSVDGDVRIAATSAVRDAVNADDFAARVKSLTDVDLEVLTGEQEAAMAYGGARRALDREGDMVLLDVGGGSTEIVVGGDEPEGWVSLQLGSVRLKERHLTDDPPSAPQIAAARIEIADQLSEAGTSLRVDGLEPRAVDALVGVAGTVTTLAMLAMRRDRFEPGAVHGREIDVATIRDWSNRLLAMQSSEIAALGPVQPGREDVIAAGALIVRGVMERLGYERVIVSEHDLLDGLLA